MTEATIIPYLAVDDAQSAIDYYAKVFGAEKVEDEFFVDDTGRVGHCSLRIGQALLYLSDEHPEIGVLGPKARGGTPVALIIHVADADAVMAAGVAAGGTVERPVENQRGHRSGWFVDPWGHRWSPTS